MRSLHKLSDKNINEIGSAAVGLGVDPQLTLRKSRDD